MKHLKSYFGYFSLIVRLLQVIQQYLPSTETALILLVLQTITFLLNPPSRLSSITADHTLRILNYICMYILLILTTK